MYRERVIMNRTMLLQVEAMQLLREQGNSRFELHVPRFFVEQGEFVAVTGESGCGKSTLLDMLALVLAPRQAQCFELSLPREVPTDLMALWQNKAEDALARIRRRYLGYVPQSGGLFPFLTVRDNLYLSAQINAQTDYAERIRKMAQRLGIAGLFTRKPASLSGGQRQRVAILRAMAHQPHLILADEPTAAVDAQRAQGIVAEFRALAQSSNTAIVMVSHDQNLLRRYSDRMYGFDVDSHDEMHVRSICREVS